MLLYGEDGEFLGVWMIEKALSGGLAAIEVVL